MRKTGSGCSIGGFLDDIGPWDNVGVYSGVEHGGVETEPRLTPLWGPLGLVSDEPDAAISLL
jgi:hypothetical protein